MRSWTPLKPGVESAATEHASKVRALGVYVGLDSWFTVDSVRIAAQQKGRWPGCAAQWPVIGPRTGDI